MAFVARSIVGRRNCSNGRDQECRQHGDQTDQPDAGDRCECYVFSGVSAPRHPEPIFPACNPVVRLEMDPLPGRGAVRSSSAAPTRRRHPLALPRTRPVRNCHRRPGWVSSIAQWTGCWLYVTFVSRFVRWRASGPSAARHVALSTGVQERLRCVFSHRRLQEAYRLRCFRGRRAHRGRPALCHCA